MPVVTEPSPPSERTGDREWDLCLGHPLIYIGMGGPEWMRDHMWTCADEGHGLKPPVYYVSPRNPQVIESDSGSHGSERDLAYFYLVARGLR